ncbi:hypothetical protein MKX07_008957 [Trichoderma sp. CBMAI-0711]|nr:hypothetical protein MKX07_008957 [Trichoderma sp. CBMAI-0711]
MHHPHRVRRNAIDIPPQPHEHLARVLVHGVHELHLLAALRHVVLVDAYLVRPQPPRPVRQPDPHQRIPDALRQRQDGAVAEEREEPVARAPDVGDCFVRGQLGGICWVEAPELETPD